MKKGYVHVYTGNGKGKTTAAFGLAVRALCAGYKVYIGQFVKSMKYNETKLTDHFKTLCVEQLGSGCYIQRKPDVVDIDMAQKALKHCAEILREGMYELVVLDELTIALHFELIRLEDVLAALANRAPHVEVVITGRYAPEALLDAADLVTEMKEVKHYYQQGVLSRNGIDR